MRKNSIRKFVHAVLDLIPLFIIPIFAIYTRNENYNSNIEVQVYENKEVDFNQRIKNGNFENNSDWGFGNSTSYSIDSNECTLTLRPSATTTYINVYQGNFFTAQIGHKYYFKYDYETSGISYTNVIYTNNTSYLGTPNKVDSQGTYETILNADIEFIRMQFTFTNNSGISSNAYVKIKNIQCFDLTQMFGENNEPTIYEFNSYFTDDYYNFTLSHNTLVPNYNVIYNDTDVGSQFVYTLYNATDKYFNMNNVFNMNDVYDWFVLNIFGGNAPLGLYIVWNIVLYEFVMDLLMLLYGVFMFFIDCCTKLIEKPLNAIK